MADIKLVIKIPEEIYEIAKQDKWKYPADDVYNAIKNGIQLPKGHGDLIDRNDLKYEKYNSYAYAIANAPTIIEADKE